MHLRQPLPLVGALALGLTLAACGGGSTDSDSADTASEQESASDEASDDAAMTSEGEMAGSGDFPVTVDTAAGEVTIEEQPQRIVSLSPSATEILFAIGAGDQVVAVDSFSTYPEEAPTTDLSGFEPNVEAIAGYEPDLVVISGDMNDLTASLTELDIPVVDNAAPTTIEAGWDGMAALGLATGHVDETADTIADLRQQVDDAFASFDGAEGLRVYHELDDTYFSASSNSFIGDVYSQFGAVNIADEADADGTGYPQLTEEAIIEADPQLIVITDQVSYTAEDVAERPGWSEISAVQNGNIVTVNADISSRWGPRLPELVTTLADAMSQVSVPAGG
ncbi:Vitamin B12 ABC transporter, B12-binding component BtuF [Serinicoccus hydrothermalis]|uniref:Vitamin B12 ABC transporter, B12-binding component BtuF n=1 Tax=Serinicoccus hydrothermalis TaxID=1758689 RepID=A0A1B1NDL8_9MICO|nr:ABC transporter substrate-binding protein [Serinicoccus hydrothermalis]ANS79540.1 Vitamin B12 ABC transporter, B12-binding component BtuF [Serinicoccus hydrothermalis]